MRHYLTDHLDSTRAVVDSSGTVLEAFDYYPFGLLMPKRNTAGANTLEKYTGNELDDEAGLNVFYAGTRYLDPALRQWLSVDPKADDFPTWSSYNYTFDNPVNLFDPDGQAPQCPSCGTNTGIQSVMGLMTHLQAFFGDKQAQQALKYSYKTRGEIAVTTLSEPADWAFTAWDAANNGPNWRHALALAPLASSGISKQIFKAYTKVDDIGNFASGKLLNQHYFEHGAEFGGKFRNAEEYVRGAQNFFKRESESIITYTRKGGDIVRYYVRNNIFGVATEKGTIRTFFKPEDNIDYIRDQIKKDLGEEALNSFSKIIGN